MRRLRFASTVPLLLTALGAMSLRAQTADDRGTQTAGARTVSLPTEVLRQLGVLTADSFTPRPTPSAALERSARYVAAEFQRLGLEPGGTEAGAPTWLQRYPLPGQQRLQLSGSTLYLLTRPKLHGAAVIAEEGSEVKRQWELNLAEAPVYFAPEVGSQAIAYRTISNFYSDLLRVGLSVTVLAGRQSVAAVQRLASALGTSAVLYIPAPGVDSATRRAILAALYARSPAVLIASDMDSAQFARTARVARQQPPALDDRYLQSALDPTATDRPHRSWALTIRASLIREWLGTARPDPAALWTDTTPVVQRLPSTALFLETAAADRSELVTAPNVIGVLTGSDPLLREQYVVLAARLDAEASGSRARGIDRPQRDSVDGAGAGLAALLAAAQAFTQPGARPRRSVLFLATSGGVESRGMRFFAAEDKRMTAGRYPAVVATFTFDGNTSGAGDSLWIDGLSEVELPTAPLWVAATHPELNLTITDGASVMRPGTGPFAFVRRTVPSLVLRTGRPDALGSTSIVALTRAAQFLVYLSEATAMAAARPSWSADGRAHLGAVLKP